VQKYLKEKNGQGRSTMGPGRTGERGGRLVCVWRGQGTVCIVTVKLDWTTNYVAVLQSDRLLVGRATEYVGST
jgi:hypothetical protein